MCPAASTRPRARRCSARRRPPQDEATPFHPRSPYGVAKVYAYWITRNYREAYGMYAVNGILFNHESPRRGETFVTRKIAARRRPHQGRPAGRTSTSATSTPAATGALPPNTSRRCGGCCSRTQPDDYVIATGASLHCARLRRACFAHVGLDWRKHVRFDERYLRPTEVDDLIGDASKAEKQLGWRATVHAPELARLMVDAELNVLQNGLAPGQQVASCAVPAPAVR